VTQLLVQSDSLTSNEKICSLIESLSDANAAKRQRTRKALVALGKAAVNPLIDLLANARPHVRWEAAKALSKIGDPAAAPALVEALGDEESNVRWLAAVGLANMKLKGLMPLLTALVKHPDSIWLREAAHHVCRELIRTESLHELAPLLDALEHYDPEVSAPIAVYYVIRRLYSSS
jgi:HEAT repeat protein